MKAANDPGLARFWQTIEAAVEAVRSAALGRLPSAVADLVDLLAGDLIPRLRAEESVLLPLVSADPTLSGSTSLNHADVSRRAEAISILSIRPTFSDVGRIHRVASELLTVLGEQRQAEAKLVTRIRALPVADSDAATLGDRLEEAVRASRDNLLLVSEADRPPTEAWVLRHNPKSTRIQQVAKGRRSPVADLVAALAVGNSITR